jgi:hypothetical protein
VNSRTTRRFRSAFAELPPEIREAAREAYRQFREDPSHPSLRFKQVHPQRSIFSARVTIHYRALGVRDGDTVVWFWIGSHADYDRLLATR